MCPREKSSSRGFLHSHRNDHAALGKSLGPKQELTPKSSLVFSSWISPHLHGEPAGLSFLDGEQPHSSHETSCGLDCKLCTGTKKSEGHSPLISDLKYQQVGPTHHILSNISATSWTSQGGTPVCYRSSPCWFSQVNFAQSHEKLCGHPLHFLWEELSWVYSTHVMKLWWPVPGEWHLGKRPQNDVWLAVKVRQWGWQGVGAANANTIYRYPTICMMHICLVYSVYAHRHFHIYIYICMYARVFYITNIHICTLPKIHINSDIESWRAFRDVLFGFVKMGLEYLESNLLHKLNEAQKMHRRRIGGIVFARVAR